MKKQTFVIVGGGLAGAEAAKSLRADGFAGRIILAGEEPIAPYERPPLSKEYLRGEVPREKLLVADPSFYDREAIELFTGTRATELRPAERTIRLEKGRRLRFDRLLLATGARAARPSLPGIDGPLVHVLRTFRDVDRLRESARQASEAVVAGGGWIAAETAASLRQLGLNVTLAVPGDQVLEKSLGATVGAIYTDLHRRHGVNIVTGARVIEVIGGGTTAGVRLDRGERLVGDLLVLGFGALPNDQLAAAAGLETRDGIIVDAHLETSAPGIFAAGDVASAWHPTYRTHVRAEHWDNARRQGRLAARNLLGRAESYGRIPYVFSDQFELGMELSGRTTPGDRVVLRRQAGDEGFVAFWLHEGRIVAGMHGNVWSAQPIIERLVSIGGIANRQVLSDPTVPLADLETAAKVSAA